MLLALVAHRTDIGDGHLRRRPPLRLPPRPISSSTAYHPRQPPYTAPTATVSASSPRLERARPRRRREEQGARNGERVERVHDVPVPRHRERVCTTPRRRARCMCAASTPGEGEEAVEGGRRGGGRRRCGWCARERGTGGGGRVCALRVRPPSLRPRRRLGREMEMHRWRTKEMRVVRLHRAGSTAPARSACASAGSGAARRASSSTAVPVSVCVFACVLTLPPTVSSIPGTRTRGTRTRGTRTPHHACNAPHQRRPPPPGASPRSIAAPVREAHARAPCGPRCGVSPSPCPFPSPPSPSPSPSPLPSQLTPAPGGRGRRSASR